MNPHTVSYSYPHLFSLLCVAVYGSMMDCCCSSSTSAYLIERRCLSIADSRDIHSHMHRTMMMRFGVMPHRTSYHLTRYAVDGGHSTMSYFRLRCHYAPSLHSNDYLDFDYLNCYCYCYCCSDY